MKGGKSAKEMRGFFEWRRAGMPAGSSLRVKNVFVAVGVLAGNVYLWREENIIMTEFEKMRSGQMYDFSSPDIHASLDHAKKLCAALQTVSIADDSYRRLIRELIPGIPDDSTVCPPFHCDHGNGIRIGRGVFVNVGCTMLDGAFITIGDNVLIGPNSQLYTPQHPIDPLVRRGSVETAFPIVIGEDSWLGGGVIVCPGVTIGARCIVAAGSVVVRDVPDDCLVAGNPATVKRRL